MKVYHNAKQAQKDPCQYYGHAKLEDGALKENCLWVLCNLTDFEQMWLQRERESEGLKDWTLASPPTVLSDYRDKFVFWERKRLSK